MPILLLSGKDHWVIWDKLRQLGLQFSSIADMGTAFLFWMSASQAVAGNTITLPGKIWQLLKGLLVYVRSRQLLIGLCNKMANLFMELWLQLEEHHKPGRLLYPSFLVIYFDLLQFIPLCSLLLGDNIKHLPEWLITKCTKRDILLDI